MIIILLRGFSKAGKDTVGEIMCNLFGYTRVAFADSLKRMTAVKYGCPLNILHTQEGKEQFCPGTTLTWRQVMIRDSLVEKKTNPDIYAELTATEINDNSRLSITSSPSPQSKFVITDWRFPNELAVIQREFPEALIKTVAVYRTGQETSPVDDPSEYLLNNTEPDYTIHNTVSMGLHPLIQKVKALCTEIDSLTP